MIQLAYGRRGRALFLVTGVAVALLSGAFGCTAGVKMSSAGSGGARIATTPMLSGSVKPKWGPATGLWDATRLEILSQKPA